MHASKRLQQSTKQLEHWNHIVEAAQERRNQELKHLFQKSKITKYMPNFQPKEPCATTTANQPKVIQKRIQQNLRKFLLRFAPNVRYKDS